MSWIFLSLGSAVAYALVNVLDKILLVRFAKSTDTALKVTGFFGALFFVCGLVYAWITDQPFAFSWFAIFGGVFEMFYIYLYYKAIEKENIAFAVPFFSLAPAAMAVVWYLLFRDTITLLQFLGILLTIAGVSAFVFAKEGTFGKIKSDSVMLMMLSLAFLILSTLCLEHSIRFVSEAQSTLVSRLGLFLGSFSIVFLQGSWNFKAFKQTFTYTFGVNEAVSALAVLLYVEAMARQSVSLVNTIINIQPLILFGMSYLLWKLSPKILSEDFHFVRPILAIVSLCALIAGATLVAL